MIRLEVETFGKLYKRDEAMLVLSLSFSACLFLYLPFPRSVVTHEGGTGKSYDVIVRRPRA